VCRVAQQLADEHLGQTRRDQYCIFVPGRPALTNGQAAREIIEEAKLLLQSDLQAMGFGIVIKKAEENIKGRFISDKNTFSICFVDEHSSNSDTDSDDENENDIPSPILSSSTIQFPSLLDDKNINVRNAYVDNKHICSEFILMIEHKETIAISCFTKKLTKRISGMCIKQYLYRFLFLLDSSVFHINNQEELHLQYIACAFSIHKVYIIDVAEDEQCKMNKQVLSEVYR
jgi:hypothetical protein